MSENAMVERDFAGRKQLLKALRAELEFFDAGGYGRPFRSQWRPTLLLLDSPVCLNFASGPAQHECWQCPFFALVPPDQQGTPVPCHHIPLNESGFTVAGLYQSGTQKSLDQDYRKWLCAMIHKFEDPEEIFMNALQTVNKISFKNIMLLTDFTEASQTALAYAMGFAKHFGAEIYPAHACDPIILTETAAPGVLDEVENHSHQLLLKLAKDNGLKGTPLFARGPVESAVPGWVDQHGIDLIVMGTHGRRGLQHFLMGSVAEAIFRNATCPVLTVGPHVNVRPYHEFKAEKILFPTDLGAHAEFATQYALSVAHDAHAQLTFMHIVSLDEAFQHDRTELVNKAYQELQRLIPPDAKQWCQPEMTVEVGDPAKELLGWAATERPDLIVLGLPAGKKFNGHFRTGVTYSIISSAPCPVLTVRDVVEA